MEDDNYAQADSLRVTLLKPYDHQVTRANDKLIESIEERDAKSALGIKDFEVEFSPSKSGLASAPCWAKIEETTNALNALAELLWQYREFGQLLIPPSLPSLAFLIMNDVIVLNIIASPVSISGDAQ